MKPFGKMASGIADNMSQEDFEMMIDALIGSIAPPIIEKPTHKLCQLLKELVEGQLGKNKQSEIILRFAINECEKDPGAMVKKLSEIEVKLAILLRDTEEEEYVLKSTMDRFGKVTILLRDTEKGEKEKLRKKEEKQK